MTQPMIRTYGLRDILVRTAAFVVLTTASTALFALPHLGTARSAPEDHKGYGSRLQAVFQIAEEQPGQDELRDALLRAVRKTDRLSSAPDCDRQILPRIQSRCLNSAEVHSSRQPVRTVTVEYRLGENRSDLVRLPARQLASQP